MKIGILGAGYVGGTLARSLASAGHQVRIANSKDPQSLNDFTDDDGVTPMWAADAVDGVDIAILSVPQKSIAAFPENVKAALSSVPIVIDTGNYYPARDGQIAALDDGMPESAWVAEQLGRSVFKAFNNMQAPSLKHKGSADPQNRLALSVAGPDNNDKQVVFSLIAELGFEPVDGGELQESWRQQPGTPVYCQDLDAEQMRNGLAKASRSDIPKYQADRDQVKDFDAAMNQMGQYM